MSEEFDTIYCYENTSVLKNVPNIRDNKKLEDYERSIVAIKLMALNKEGITGDFSINHFLSIHKFLFEDIYPFAGKLRRTNISKGFFQFAQWEYIESELENLLFNLKKENYLKGLDIMTFVKRLAYYWSEINVLHPFREGNRQSYTRISKAIIFEEWIYFKFKKCPCKRTSKC